MLPSSEMLALGVRFQWFGAFAQAERLYREILHEQPDHAEVWCRLGDVCQALGKHAEAVYSYSRCLELRPEYVRAHNNLGVALMELRQPDEAAARYDEAIRLQPDFAEAHNNLGIARMEQGQLDQAEARFREALRLKPAYPAAQNNLGGVLARQGRLQEAAASFGQAVELQPDFFRAWLGLGDALRRLGRREEAGASFQRAAHLRPADPGPLAELAALLMELGRPADAAVCYERLVQLQPDSAEVCNNLGLAQLNANRTEEAVLSFRQALYLQPSLADVHNNLGLALAARGDPDEARICYERALQLMPDHFGALVNLGNACKDQGLLAEAIAYYRKSLEVRPHAAGIHSNLLLALQYQEGADPLEILAEAHRYTQRHVAPLAGTIKPHPVHPPEGRRLRIGYVSADFREHPVAYFLEPILANHDHQCFEIFCYADVVRPDSLTQRFRGYADHWRSLVGSPDEQAAEMIRRDGIDILVDLAGHTGGNRLLTFARKPAPIQASYLGYLGTTGMPTMDYYITDAYADPPRLSEAHYQEHPIRLPECGFCYQPGLTPEVNVELPASQTGQMTFASLNTVAKLSEKVLNLWARILTGAPGSRLLLRSGAGRHAEERLRDILAHHNISPARVQLLGPTPTRFDYLKLYQAVDLCLDPFPYNGVTTTCDALWMGVPVLTLAGHMNVSRQGVRFLSSVGLKELIAESSEHYTRLAIELADNLERLSALRAGLRERMSRSPLMDAQRLTHSLETTYCEMWQKWAAGKT
jgi:protein O-GlcNAc transferase